MFKALDERIEDTVLLRLVNSYEFISGRKRSFREASPMFSLASVPTRFGLGGLAEFV